MHDIRKTIANYIGNRDNIGIHTLRCFVGMRETGEATDADFDAVKPGLAATVREFQTLLINTEGAAKCRR
jgi:hypothetical protein